MLEATDSIYWKALIATLYETGARIGEIQSLKYKASRIQKMVLSFIYLQSRPQQAFVR